MSERNPGDGVVDLAFERAKAEARVLLDEHPELRSERTAAFLAGEGEKPMPARRDYVHLSLRLPKALVDRIDALLPQLGAAPELATAGTVKRADGLRLAILKGVAQLESEFSGHPALPGTEDER